MLNITQLVRKSQEYAISELIRMGLIPADSKINKALIEEVYQGLYLFDSNGDLCFFEPYPMIEDDPYFNDRLERVLPGLYLEPVIHIFSSADELKRFSVNHSLNKKLVYVIATLSDSSSEIIKVISEDGDTYQNAFTIFKKMKLNI